MLCIHLNGSRNKCSRTKGGRDQGAARCSGGCQAWHLCPTDGALGVTCIPDPGHRHNAPTREGREPAQEQPRPPA